MLWNISEQVDVPVTQADFLEAISNVNRSVGGGVHGAYAGAAWGNSMGISPRSWDF